METIKAFGGKSVTRAPKGGFDHPVNGKFYKGGRFCPLYAVAGGSEEAKPEVALPGETLLVGMDGSTASCFEHRYSVVRNDSYQGHQYEATCRIDNYPIAEHVALFRDAEDVAAGFEAAIVAHFSQYGYSRYFPIALAR